MKYLLLLSLLLISCTENKPNVVPAPQFLSKEEIEITKCYCKLYGGKLVAANKNANRIDFTCKKSLTVDFKLWIYIDTYVEGCSK